MNSFYKGFTNTLTSTKSILLTSFAVIISVIISVFISNINTYKYVSDDRAVKGFIGFTQYINIKEYREVGGGSFKISCLGGEYDKLSRSDRHETILICK